MAETGRSPRSVLVDHQRPPRKERSAATPHTQSDPGSPIEESESLGAHLRESRERMSVLSHSASTLRARSRPVGSIAARRHDAHHHRTERHASVVGVT
eukprot:421667-Rhodomonas_salina.1